MKVGDLIKFTHQTKPHENDIGVITDVDDFGVKIHWTNTMTIGDLSHKMLSRFAHAFEVVK